MASSPGRSWRSTAAEVSSSRRVSLTLRHPHAAHPPSSVRVSRADPGAPTALFIGCSFTQGWAISDQETFPWGVQEHFPAARVLNAGTAGYGTYQSLLGLSEPSPRRSIRRWWFTVSSTTMRCATSPILSGSTWGAVLKRRTGRRSLRHPRRRGETRSPPAGDIPFRKGGGLGDAPGSRLVGVKV